MAANKKVPALRFLEFKDEWKFEKIDSHVDFFSGHPFNTEDIKEERQGTRLLRGINITEGRIRSSEDIDRFYHKEVNGLSKFLLKEGDVVIGMDGSKVGKNSAIIDTNNSGTLLVQRVARLRQKAGTSLPFIYQHLTSKIFHRYVDAVKTSSGIPHISGQQIKDFSIWFPSMKEQQKIGSFFTAMDDKIQQLTKKKALLEQYKKGVMQQIFSSQIRFKDENGKGYPKWEEKDFGEVFTFINTNSFSRSQLNYDNGTVKNIHYGDIHTKFKSNFFISKEQVPFINKNIDLKKVPEEHYCKEGDLIIADASEDYKDIGKSIEVVELDDQRLLAGLHTYIARDEHGLTAKGFKGYMMQSFEVREQMMKKATGISVLGITKGNLSKIRVKLPTLKEQQKIADFLTNIDNKIEQIGKQLEQTQLFKKGLLQKMFV